jgi:hypothetical protein
MPSTATITAKTGAGQTATSLTLSDVTSFVFDCLGNTCTVFFAGASKQQTFAGYSTIAATVSGTTAGSTYTLTLS